VTNSDDKVQKHIFILISYEIKKNKRGMLATKALTITNRQTLRYLGLVSQGIDIAL
jgi:hypothetical protein